MISYAQRTSEEQPDVASPAADDHIAPAPRVSVQAFCETVETAAAVQSGGEDRRLGKAHLKIQMGGMAAAIEAIVRRRRRTSSSWRPKAATTSCSASISWPPCATPEPA